MADTILDTKGMACPLPILKAKKAMQGLEIGQTMEVLATDPGSWDDFVAFCETTGATLVERDKSGGVYRFLIRK